MVSVISISKKALKTTGLNAVFKPVVMVYLF